MENAVASIEYIMDNNLGKLPINILVDLSFINQKFVTASVSTYALQLVKELMLIPHMKFSFIAEEWFIPSLKKDFDQVRCFSVPTKRWLRYLPFEFLRSYVLAMIRRSYITKTIKTSEYNVCFTPFLNAVSILTNMHPSIAVLHDARPWEITRKAGYLKGTLFSYLTRPVIKSQDYIVTISKAAKEDIYQALPWLRKKIFVIYNSVKIEEQSIKGINKKCELYILYVNTLHEYKNVITLIHAFHLIKEQLPYKLVIRGKPTSHFNQVVIPLINELGLKDDRIVIIDKRLSDTELFQLYQYAALFVSPSASEGFGYTPIEAAICKVPVVVADTAVLSEVSMGLLNYYKPATSARALADKILQVITHPPTDEQLQVISEKLKEKYSSKNQAKQFAELFQLAQEELKLST